MDGGAWWAIVHGVAKSQTQLSDFTSLFILGFPGGSSGKEPACQSRRRKKCRFDPWVWKIPWRRAWQSTPVFLPGESQMEEPGGLQSIGSQTVRHDWTGLARTHANLPEGFG